MDIPIHLQGALMFDAPILIQNFASKYNAQKVFFVDDAVKCNNSFRLNSTIFVNTRATYWANYTLPPMNCKSVPETIVLRFLHELGHIYCGHSGDDNLLSTPNGLLINRSIINSVKEDEAWEFAFNIRKNNEEDFIELINTCQNWYSSHIYNNKDWDDNVADQIDRVKKLLKSSHIQKRKY